MKYFTNSVHFEKPFRGFDGSIKREEKFVHQPRNLCDAVCCSVLQCVAVCCSMLQFSGEEEFMHQSPRSTRKTFGYHAGVCV